MDAFPFPEALIALFALVSTLVVQTAAAFIGATLALALRDRRNRPTTGA
jgi:hypothetical protein